MKKYSHYIYVRVSEKDYNELVEKAKECKLSISDYVRCKLFGRAVMTKEERQDLNKLIYEIDKIGVNLNQLAWRKNAGMSLSTEDIKQGMLPDFEAVYAVHLDKAHLHSHICFNSVSYAGGHMYHYKRGDFKSITVDNGIEFSDDVGAVRSIYGGVRTKLYYCHPYGSWERATNEVSNRLVRRHVLKSTNFDDMTDEGAAYIENWINDYPRRQFGFRSARELFDEEIAKLKAG